MSPRCPHCGAGTRKSPGPVARTIVIGGAWTVILGMLIGLSLASLFAVPLVPIIIFAGAALIGSAHEYAFGDRICEVCGRAYELDGEPIELVEPWTEPAISAIRPGATATA